MRERSGKGTLFVFDNFESLEDQLELYYWIDTYLRLPNKAVITTRKRQFTSDTPIELTGMSVDESRKLIDQTATRLGIRDLILSPHEAALIDISDGHPYVLRILLGDIKKEGKYISRARMLADKDVILDALFENIYGELSELEQRIFLTLCELQAAVAEIAIQAVLIGKDSRPLDISTAIDRLHSSSLIERNEFEQGEEFFCNVPYVTSIFGKSKLMADPISIDIQSDIQFLRYFGTAHKSDFARGIRSIVRKFFSNVETECIARQYRRRTISSNH